MSRALENRVAFVTGAAGGIGLQVCRDLAGEGATVALSDLHPAAVDQAVARLRGEGLEVFGAPCDVSREDQLTAALDAAAARQGRIDILVNNAGTNIPQDLMHTDETSWDTVVDADLKGVVFVAQAAAARMIEAKHGGRIVNVASVYGVIGRRERVAHDVIEDRGVSLALAQTIAVEDAVELPVEVVALVQPIQPVDLVARDRDDVPPPLRRSDRTASIITGRRRKRGRISPVSSASVPRMPAARRSASQKSASVARPVMYPVS